MRREPVTYGDLEPAAKAKPTRPVNVMPSMPMAKPFNPALNLGAYHHSPKGRR